VTVEVNAAQLIGSRDLAREVNFLSLTGDRPSRSDGAQAPVYALRCGAGDTLDSGRGEDPRPTQARA
jgi:hypothetical protein